MGTKPLLLKYPLDLTGRASTNLIIDEPHTIGSTTKRAFVPNSGPFYTESVKIVDIATGEPLTPVSQYLILQPYQEASIRTGLDVASVIYIVDKTVGSELLVTYQVVGGEFSWSVYALQEMLDTLDLDTRPVAWGDIIGKPNAYPPTPHLHDLGDTYGWEYIAAQLEGIRDAILTGDAAAHDELRQQFVYLDDKTNKRIDALDDLFQEHVDNYENPHKVTKTQINLGLVENFPVATDSEAAAGTVKNRYMTPWGTAQAIAKQAGDLINAHISDKNNPHNTTKLQVGLGNVDNFATASDAEAITDINNRFMTPHLTRVVVDNYASTPLRNHLADYNNPHRVTKNQVGLGLVDNFPTASVAQAAASAAYNQNVTGDQFISVTGLNTAIRTIYNAIINPHITDYNNPHRTTAAQVGLGNLTNDKQVVNTSGNAIKLAWNGTELRVTVDSTSMGRMHTTAQPDPNLTSHIANKNNPHGVTAAQVGAYTVAQINNLLANKLDKTATAYNSDRFAGRDYTSAYNDIRSNLSTAHIASGVFHQTRLGSGGYNGNYVLTGDQQWTAFSTIFNRVMGSVGGGEHSINGNGYYWRDKSTGFIIQCGIAPEMGPDRVQGPYPFPTGFPNNVVMVLGNKITPNHVDGDGNAAGAYPYDRGGYMIFNDTNRYNARIAWIAIGY